MGAVLGIDAAWTAKNPSGAALAARVHGRWTCLAVAPSYDRFCALADGRLAQGRQWEGKPAGGAADVPALLAASRRLLTDAGLSPTVDAVAVDMPLAPEPITVRREADNAASRVLARYKCGVHSPTAGRPGELGAALTQAFVDQGFPLVACGDGGRPVPALLEVYPHAVMVALKVEHGGVPKSEAKRCQYKVSRARQYWPDLPRHGRLAFLRHNLGELLGLLGRVLDFPPIPLTEAHALSALKPVEDSLDALACCVMGIRYLEGKARCLGDAAGAIWVPDTV